MKYSGTEAINVLSRRISDDPTESSHWKNFTENFHIKRYFIWYKGFGGSQPTYQGLKKKYTIYFKENIEK